MAWLFVIYFISQILILSGYRKMALTISLFLWIASIMFFIEEVSMHLNIRL